MEEGRCFLDMETFWGEGQKPRSSIHVPDTLRYASHKEYDIWRYRSQAGKAALDKYIERKRLQERSIGHKLRDMCKGGLEPCENFFPRLGLALKIHGYAKCVRISRAFS